MDVPRDYPITVMVRPSGSCNLACRYCFAQGAEGFRMGGDVLSAIVRSALGTDRRRVRFLWHGGEPLLAGPGLFREALELQQRYRRNGQKVRNDVQTNGTLVTREFAELLKEHSFGVGVSMDGPREMHDSNRVHSDGRGTYDEVIRGIGLLAGTGIRVGGIAVLSRDNCRDAKAVYDAYKSAGLSLLTANPCLCPGDAEFAVAPSDVGRAWCALFDAWAGDPEPLERVDPIHDVTRGLFAGRMEACSFSGLCFTDHIAFDWNGDAYPCNRFIGVEAFRLGNIGESSVEDLLDHPLYGEVGERWKRIDECASCSVGELCRAGCTYSAYLATGGVDAKDPLCEARFALFEHVTSRVIDDMNGGKRIERH